MRKLTFFEKAGYGFGDIANSAIFTMSAMFLLIFYTDVLKIPAYQAGALFMIARVYDAFADAIMGMYVDGRGQKNITGKFRPFILKGCWPILFISILTFTAPNFDETGRIAWAYVTYLLWGMAYTFINIPYGSLAAAMTDDLRDRASLSIFRSLGSKIGAVIPQLLVLPIIMLFSNPKHGWAAAAVLISIISLICYMICYRNTVEQITHNNDKEEISVTKVIYSLRKNRPFWGVSLASIATVTAWMLNGTMAIYYFKFNLQAEEFYWIKGILTVLPTIILTPILGWFVYRLGNRKIAIYGSIISCFFFSSIMFLPSNLYLYLIIYFLGFFFYSLPDNLLWMMIADSVDYGEWLSGIRTEGIIYSAYSFMRKIAQAIAGLIAGFGLTIVGYNAHITTQSEHTLFGIKFLTNGIPAIGMLIAFLIFIFIYNLTPKVHDEMISELRERHSKNSSIGENNA